LLREFIDAEIVIFADVLEHFKNPWNVLSRIGNWMPSGAKIIACIPNVQHWSVQMRILAGDFHYQETGLLDKTHLRFFTRKTMVHLFEQTDFEVEKIIPRIFDFPKQDDFLLRIKKMAELGGIDQNQAVIDAAAFQYVIIAKNK
jgi:2-polyprenyl-3-methyl-5-hydroxy-6-metoxy-1,4-benzoquinol methylase